MSPAIQPFLNLSQVIVNASQVLLIHIAIIVVVSHFLHYFECNRKNVAKCFFVSIQTFAPLYSPCAIIVVVPLIRSLLRFFRGSTGGSKDVIRHTSLARLPPSVRLFIHSRPGTAKLLRA